MKQLGNAHEHGLLGEGYHGLSPGQMAAIKAKSGSTGGIMGGSVRPLYGGKSPNFGTGSVKTPKSMPMKAPSLSRAGQTPPSAKPSKLSAPTAAHASQAKGKPQSLPSFAMGGSKVKNKAGTITKPAATAKKVGHAGGHSPLDKLQHAGHMIKHAGQGAAREAKTAAQAATHASIQAAGAHAPVAALAPKGHGFEGGLTHEDQRGELRHVSR